jgi:hypothetical protein
MKPVKYYQIVTPDTNGVLRPFEINQFGEVDSFFKTSYEAEEFIKNNFLDAQETGSNPPINQVDVVLSIMPVFLCRYKQNP